MRRIINAIPNTLTLCNLAAGCVAVVAALRGAPEVVFWAVVAAAAFDFFDGFAARLLKAYSPIGADLDSLCDVVSFGLAPALAVFVATESQGWVSYTAFLLVAAGALRLAKFNVDTRQTTEFRGVPIPAMAIFFISYQFAAPMAEGWQTAAIVVVMALLMVSDVPMLALKFKDFSIRNNLLRYVFLVLCVAIIAVGDIYLAPMGIILLYVAASTASLLTRIRLEKK